jgi:hypothetical protein
MLDSKAYYEINFTTESYSEFAPAKAIEENPRADDRFYTLNDSSLYSVKEKGKKNVYMTKPDGSQVSWRTEAQELRVSPDGQHVVM